MEIELTYVQPYSWFEGYANRPSFSFVVNELPKGRDWSADKGPAGWVYERKGSHFCAQNGPLIRYLYSAEKECDGFGGSKICLQMKDGSLYECNGAWSSDAYSVSKAFRIGVHLEGGVITQSEFEKVRIHPTMGFRHFGGTSHGVSARAVVDWYMKAPRDHMGIMIYSDRRGDIRIEPTKPGNYARIPEEGSVVHHMLESGCNYAYDTQWCKELRQKIYDLLK